MNTINISVFLIAVSCAIFVTFGILGYARTKLLDSVTERSSHTAPTPRGGGVGLVVGALLGWSAWLTIQHSWDFPALTVALAITMVAALGWWDDHVDLSPRIRLLVQFLSVFAVAWVIGLPLEVRVGQWIVAVPSWLAWSLVAFVGLGVINLTNFMDGIDGIAAGQGCVVALVAGLVLIVDPQWASLGIATSGACLGFLWWNRPPARIFMGDVGSTALGLIVFVFMLVELREGLRIEVVCLPFAPFLIDATATLVRRVYRRERLTQAHRSHLYQRLARHWGSHLPVTGLYVVLAALGAVGAWLTVAGWASPWWFVGGIAGVFIALTIFARRVAMP